MMYTNTIGHENSCEMFTSRLNKSHLTVIIGRKRITVQTNTFKHLHHDAKWLQFFT